MKNMVKTGGLAAVLAASLATGVQSQEPRLSELQTTGLNKTAEFSATTGAYK